MLTTALPAPVSTFCTVEGARALATEREFALLISLCTSSVIQLYIYVCVHVHGCVFMYMYVFVSIYIYGWWQDSRQQADRETASRDNNFVIKETRLVPPNRIPPTDIGPARGYQTFRCSFRRALITPELGETGWGWRAGGRGSPRVAWLQFRTLITIFAERWLKKWRNSGIGDKRMRWEMMNKILTCDEWTLLASGGGSGNSNFTLCWFFK